MSQYTSEYLQEKLQKEFNPIHLVREKVLPSLYYVCPFVIADIDKLI